MSGQFAVSGSVGDPVAVAGSALVSAGKADSLPVAGSIAVSIVDACMRAGLGGSPTAVLPDEDFSEIERCRIPALLGTSHVVFVSARDPQWIGLRFFTSAGELPACGHGTVAALAFVASQSADGRHGFVLEAGGRRVGGHAVNRDGACHAAFDPGDAHVREASVVERELVLSVLGLDAGVRATEISVASLGRARLLVPVASRSALAALAPDLDRLHTGCDELGLLGCYVYTGPESEGQLAARMFAPSIGVSEDIANANSTACLAARLAQHGLKTISVDMGDSLGHPATITATADTRGTQLKVLVGGEARIASTRTLCRAALTAD